MADLSSGCIDVIRQFIERIGPSGYKSNRITFFGEYVTTEYGIDFPLGTQYSGISWPTRQQPPFHPHPQHLYASVRAKDEGLIPPTGQY